MLITITSIANTDSDPVVCFTCDYGTGQGLWKIGVPKLNHDYDVELEISDALRAGTNTKLTSLEVPRLSTSGHLTTLITTIEDRFDNNTACLRLGDSLILVEHEDGFPTPGTWVEITVPQIELYDTRI